MSLFRYRRNELLRGLLIYAAGDSVAALLTCQFSLHRMVGMMAVGGFVYSLEIPSWFRYIARRWKGVPRALMAMLYFNPLWIARHLTFIALFSGDLDGIGWCLVTVSLKSFAVNLPFSFVANYLIQNKVPVDWRFFASAIFSALMAVYYSACGVIFA